MGTQTEKNLQQATFGAGCFWGAESAFQAQQGVINSRVGFARSSDSSSPWIEVVQVDFDPAQVSYHQLLALFWKIHDPLSVDKQGQDVGEKYRSAVFAHSEQQASEAAQSKAALEAEKYPGKVIVTVIDTLDEFKLADEKDQQYIQKHGGSACSI